MTTLAPGDHTAHSRAPRALPAPCAPRAPPAPRGRAAERQSGTAQRLSDNAAPTPRKRTHDCRPALPDPRGPRLTLLLLAQRLTFLAQRLTFLAHA
ncbi:hypothetical protein [Streptomyces sp. NPDC058252]|uniref:hypothetical protein n=1 Tax=Streptomyces sp. NPDC058252 TaxID=3346405 RepID=UPI0036F008C5